METIERDEIREDDSWMDGLADEPAPDVTGGLGKKTGPASILDRLKQRHDELGEDWTKEFPVPGYGDELFLRCGVVEWEKLSEIAERVADIAKTHPKAKLLGQIDTIIAAHREVVVKIDGEFHRPCDVAPLREAAGLQEGEALRLDGNLASMLEFDADTARQAVVGLFNGKEFQITLMHNDLMEWMGDADARIKEKFVGESLSTAT